MVHVCGRPRSSLPAGTVNFSPVYVSTAPREVADGVAPEAGVDATVPPTATAARGASARAVSRRARDGDGRDIEPPRECGRAGWRRLGGLTTTTPLARLRSPSSRPS